MLDLGKKKKLFLIFLGLIVIVAVLAGILLTPKQKNWVDLKEILENPRNRLNISNISIWWAKTFWHNGYRGVASYDYPLVMDLDGDGYREIVKFCKFWHIGYRAWGDILMNLSYGSILHGTYLFGDFDGDNTYDIVFGTGSRRIVIVDPNGTVKLLVNVTKKLGRTESLLFGEFDGDPGPEFVVKTNPHGIYVVEPHTWEVRFVGRYFGGHDFGDVCYIYPVDADGDGVFEIFFALTQEAYVGLMGLNGTVFWDMHVDVPDVEDATRGPPLPAHVSVGDFDRDGEYEAVFTTENSEIYVVSVADGSVEGYIYVEQPRGTAYSGCRAFGFVDIDGDGSFEGVFPWTHFSFPFSRSDWAYGSLVFVDMDSYSVIKTIGFRHDLDDTWFGLDCWALSVVDFNLDGFYDFVVVSYRYIVFIDGKDLSVDYVYDGLDGLGRGFYAGGLLDMMVVFDVDGDGFVEIIKPHAEQSIVVYRVFSGFRPLVYWNPPWGYYNAFGLFDLFDGDYDGVADWVEEAYGFDPTRADSDGDGVSDRAEILEILREMQNSTDSESKADTYLHMSAVLIDGFDEITCSSGIFCVVFGVEEKSDVILEALLYIYKRREKAFIIKNCSCWY